MPSSSVRHRRGPFFRGATSLALLLALAGGARAQSSDPLGDRLIVGVNNVPYTQRQVESYILVKESLRKTEAGPERAIDARSWPQAVAVFSDDMIVLQEAERLGSYQNEGALVAKFRDVVKQKVAQSPPFAAALKRIGLEDLGVTRTLESVLRVAAFRKAKDKGAADEKRAKWLGELTDRAVVRFYKGATIYVPISPTGAAGG